MKRYHRNKNRGRNQSGKYNRRNRRAPKNSGASTYGGQRNRIHRKYRNARSFKVRGEKVRIDLKHSKRFVSQYLSSNDRIRVKFDLLPKELWLDIFLYLSLVENVNIISLVSKECYSLVHSPFFFQVQSQIFSMDFDVYKNLYAEKYPNDETYAFKNYESMFRKRFVSNLQNFGRLSFLQNTTSKLFKMGRTEIIIPKNIILDKTYALEIPDTRPNLMFLRSKVDEKEDKVYLIDMSQMRLFGPISLPQNRKFQKIGNLFCCGNVLIVVEKTTSYIGNGVEEDEEDEFSNVYYLLFDSKSKDFNRIKDHKKLMFQSNDIISPYDDKNNSYIFRYVARKKILKVIDEREFREREIYEFCYKYKEEYPDIKEMQVEDSLICCIFNDEIIVMRFFPLEMKVEQIKHIKMDIVFRRFSKFRVRKDFILDGSIYILFKEKRSSTTTTTKNNLMIRNNKQQQKKEDACNNSLVIVKVRLDGSREEEIVTIDDPHDGIFEGFLIHPCGKLLTICSFFVETEVGNEEEGEDEEVLKENVIWKTFSMFDNNNNNNNQRRRRRKNFRPRFLKQNSIVTGSQKYTLKKYFEKRYGSSDLLVLGECQNHDYSSLKIQRFSLTKNEDEDEKKKEGKGRKVIGEQFEIADVELCNICVTEKGIIIVRNER